MSAVLQVDFSFATFALSPVGVDGIKLAQSYYTFKANQPYLPIVMSTLGLLLPFAYYKLATADVWPLISGRARGNFVRHAFGTATLLGLTAIIGACQ